MKFEWDEDKSIANESKHNVSFDEAMTVFVDPLHVDFYDPEHSQQRRSEKHMKKDEININEELQPEYDPRSLRVRKPGPGRSGFARRSDSNLMSHKYFQMLNQLMKRYVCYPGYEREPSCTSLLAAREMIRLEPPNKRAGPEPRR